MLSLVVSLMGVPSAASTTGRGEVDVAVGGVEVDRHDVRDETCTLNGVPCNKFKHPKWSKKRAKKLRNNAIPSTDHLRKVLGPKATKAIKRLYRKHKQRTGARCCDVGGWFAEMARKGKCAAASAAHGTSYAACANGGRPTTVRGINDALVKMAHAIKKAVDNKVARFTVDCGGKSLLGWYGLKVGTEPDTKIRKVGWVGVGWALAECSNGYMSNKFWPYNG